MKISVVIPTYNKVSRLRYTIRGLEHQDLCADDFEVIIINDGSDDETEEFLKNYHPTINLKYFSQKNSGQAVARNKGIEWAGGRLILLLDDDILTSPHLLSRHIKEHEDQPHTIVLGKINLIKASDFPKVEQLILDKGYLSALGEVNSYIWKDPYLDMVEAIHNKKMDVIFWICFTGGNTSIEKEDILTLKGFDTEFYRWGPEDIELGYRCFQVGLHFKYCSSLISFHLDQYKRRAQMLSDTAKNVKYLRAKYPQNQSIANYIDYTCGGFSLEEFYCREMQQPFNPKDYSELITFKPFDYINLKSEG